MPFTMHTFDLFFIHYFPYQLVRHGVFDVYGFIREQFPGFQGTYYGPVAYFVVAGYLFILQFLLPQLDQLFDIFQNAWSAYGGGTVHYASWLGDHHFYRTLFLLKTPYLMFDFLTAFFLARLAKDSKQSLFCYKLWMLNPLTLYSIYAIGQLDLLPILFTVAALYSAAKEKKSLSVFFLSLGGLVKVYPFLFIPLFVLLLAKSWRERVKLVIASLLPILFLFLPLHISSKGAAAGCVFISALENVTGENWRKILFAAGYFFLLFHAYRSRSCGEKGVVANQLMLLTLLWYAFSGQIKFRYLSWLSPFLILAIGRDRKLGVAALLLILFMAEVHLGGNQVQWGLWSPISPEFFSSLPILDSFFVAASLPVAAIHKVSYYFSLVLVFIIFFRVLKWQNK